MDCITCGAPLPSKSNLCIYCNRLNETDLRTLRRTAAEGELSQRPCPRCQEPLRLVRLCIETETLELDRCDQCFGIFFDPGELESILEKQTKSLQNVDSQRIQKLLDEETPREDARRIQYVPCPSCTKLMNRKAYGSRSGVIIDSCRDHGIWLDGGELKRLLQWSHAGGRLHHERRREELAAEEKRRQQLAKQVEGPATQSVNPRHFPDTFGGRRTTLLDAMAWVVDLVTDLR